MPEPDQPQTVSKADVYAAYGEALYLAQSMEMGMRIFYYLDKTLPNIPPGKSPRLDFDDESLPEINTNSLGGFIRQFRRELLEEGAIDPQTRSLMRKLEQSVEYRNWLVHTYWWERSSQFNTAEGRAEMLAELQELIAQFRGYDQMICRFVLLYFAHYGLDPLQIASADFQSYLGRGELG